MVILSEGWFQFVIIGISIVLLAVTLVIVHRSIQKKGVYTKARERTSSFLVFLMALTLYFIMSVFTPAAYGGDVLIASDQEKHVESEQVRYIHLSSVFRVHAIDTRDYTRDIQGRTIGFRIQSFSLFMKLKDEAYVRSDGTINVSDYIDGVVLSAFEQLQAEEVTLTQVRESFPHIEMSIE
ncbi:LOW QUALITY PROTEIN: hypothetical protein JCM19047_2184 [Bacillus sp. JCM 19047]|nr:LOW QUALITY PROTEIN: hypothetical protein JCM19047_2184 [Bacillus sp. JCM 19047]